MKQKTKSRFLALLLTICIIAITAPGEAMTAFAASRKTISKVTINLEMDLTAGDSLPDLEGGDKGSGGNVQIPSNDKYEIGEVKWVSSTSKDVKIGASYTLKVTLDAIDSDTYGFVGTYKSSNVTVKGGTFVSASRKGYDSLIVTVKTKPVKGDFDAPDEAYWKQNQLGYAKWEKVDHVDAYDVTLYKGNSAVYKVKEYKGSELNFYPYMTSAGTYSFKVRSVPTGETQKEYAKSSDWTESGEIYIAREAVSDGTGKVDYNTSSVTNNSTMQVGWIQDGSRWWYRYPDGSYQKDSWLLVNNAFYLFDKDGWMLTGWQDFGGNTYYLDGSGAMRIGWVQAANGWYYLNPGPEGAIGAMYKNQWLDENGKRYFLGETGVMCEGWKEIGAGNWYYFYPGNGSMAVNTYISTFYVGPDGVWRK